MQHVFLPRPFCQHSRVHVCAYFLGICCLLLQETIWWFTFCSVSREFITTFYVSPITACDCCQLWALYSTCTYAAWTVRWRQRAFLWREHDLHNVCDLPRSLRWCAPDLYAEVQAEVAVIVWRQRDAMILKSSSLPVLSAINWQMTSRLSSSPLGALSRAAWLWFDTSR